MEETANGVKIEISIYRHDPAGVKTDNSIPLFDAVFLAHSKKKRPINNHTTRSQEVVCGLQNPLFHLTAILTRIGITRILRPQKTQQGKKHTCATHNRPYTVHNVRDPRSSLEGYARKVYHKIKSIENRAK